MEYGQAAEALPSLQEPLLEREARHLTSRPSSRWEGQAQKGKAMSAIENGRFRVWSYVRPSGHSKSSGFLRGTSAPITEWAYALVDESSAPLLVYDLASGKSGFPSAEHAVRAARQADWERAERSGHTPVPRHVELV